MIFHFSIYHHGALNLVASEWACTERARAKAFRLIELAAGPVANDIVRSGQTRVVVSDDAGLDLFTLAYIAADPAARAAAAA